MPTRFLSGPDVARRIEGTLPGAVLAAEPQWTEVQPEQLVAVCTFLRNDPELDLVFLCSLTGVHRLDHFEVVYHLQSLKLNHLATLKAKSWENEEPELPSVTPLFSGAIFQEREAYDLLGIRFQGHPDLRRLFLWDGFPGHPLRKDWLGMPGQRMSGLQGFPGEPGFSNEGRG